MNKHFIKPAALVAVAMGLGFIAMSFEARAQPLTLPHESACYALAAAAGYQGQAANHRINLRQYRDTAGADTQINYYIGFEIGYATAKSENMMVPLSAVAGAVYKNKCQVEI